MIDEKQAFAKRLQDAMLDVGLNPKPSVLLMQYSLAHEGAGVSFQAVSNWLNGKAIPRQEKLQTLAELLGISPTELRYGKSSMVREQALPWNALPFQDRRTIEAFLGLNPAQREAVGKVVFLLRDGLGKSLPTEALAAVVAIEPPAGTGDSGDEAGAG